MRRRALRLRRVVDVGIPVAVALFLVSYVESVRGLAAREAAAGISAALAQGVALWWRRSRPVAVMAVTIAGSVVIQLVAPGSIFPFAALIALFSLTGMRPPAVSLPALAGVLGVTALAYRTDASGDVSFALGIAAVVWAMGEAMRNRVVATREAAQRAIGEEQARLARELHDVIAHSVSVMVVQAAAADDVFEAEPAKARAALRSIEATGRDALGELRRVLAPVRGGDAPQDVAPQPGLARLPALVASLRASGLEVTVCRDGDAAALPAGVDLQAYRIVQESLTNTLRHGGASRADVRVRVAAGCLELDVRDDGVGEAPAPDASHGRGISGMRERASLLGGVLEAGGLPEGGFRVYSRIPLGGDA